jgi:arylsulfatase A-like enzyme
LNDTSGIPADRSGGDATQRYPAAIQPGTVIGDPVSGMDMFSTVLDYAAVPAARRDGDSLRPLIEGRGGAGPDYRVSEWGTRNVPSYMMRTRDWKLMFAASPDSRACDALYDLKNDPHDMRNLLGEPADRAKYTGRATEMRPPDRMADARRRTHARTGEATQVHRVITG